MQLAYHSNIEKRVAPTYSGQKGICPLCGGAVIGKCGEIYERHWQHTHYSNCDPWGEPETSWHREWKKRFPEDMREIVMESFSQKHRADIRTYTGTVIEFQHSSISKSTIRIREMFYGKMIWVIDAKPFKDNLSKWSLVKARLRDIDMDISEQLSSLKKKFRDELKRLPDRLRANKEEISSKNKRIHDIKSELKKLLDDISDIDDVSKTIVDKWEAAQQFWKSHSASITNDLEDEYWQRLKEYNTRLTSLRKERQQLVQAIEQINGLEDLKVENKIYKIIPYSRTSTKNFHNVRAISKDSRKTFFAEVIKIANETEYHTYRYKQDKFDFAIDPADSYNNWNAKIKQIDMLVSELVGSINQIRVEVKYKFLGRLQKKVQELETEEGQLNVQLNKLEIAGYDLVLKQEQSELFHQRDFEESRMEIEREGQEKRSKIMKERKGFYTFRWKHERKSWQDAHAPVYFDFGDGFLYEKIRDDMFKRITVHEFTELHGEKH